MTKLSSRSTDKLYEGSEVRMKFLVKILVATAIMYKGGPLLGTALNYLGVTDGMISYGLAAVIAFFLTRKILEIRKRKMAGKKDDAVAFAAVLNFTLQTYMFATIFNLAIELFFIEDKWNKNTILKGLRNY